MFQPSFCRGLAILFLVAFTAVALHSQSWRKRSDAVGYNVGINPHNANTIYCERSGGSLSVSRDRGATWTTFPTSPPIYGVRHILVHPKDTLTIFAVAFSGGLWKTTNEGTSWYQVIGGGYGIDGESMDYDPARPDTMYAGNFGNGAVYRSSNRGETWTFQGFSGSNLCALTIRPDSVNILFAGTGGSTISKSTDYGVTWRVVNNGGTIEVPRIVVNPNNPLIAYATTYGNDVDCNLWKTTNGGETWFKTAHQNIGIWSIAIDEQNPETLYIGRFGGTVGIDRTTDGGATFTQMPSGLLPAFNAWNLRVHPLDPTMVLVAGSQGTFGPPGGVFRLFDTLSATVADGTIRDANTTLPIAVNLKLQEPNDSLVNTSTYQFFYYDGDPTLTPSLHISKTGYVSLDTTLGFVVNSTQTADFFLQPLPFNSLNGVVFEDLDGDGLQDSGEPGLPAWTVNLAGPVTQATSTGADGAYSFDSLVTGTYTISETMQAGYYPTGTPCALAYTVSFIAGTSQQGLDFSNKLLSPGSVLLFENFTTSTFPPPCWSVVDLNGGITWHRVTTNNYSEPGSARNGVGNMSDSKPNDWLFTRGVRLQAGKEYRVSWWNRSFVNGLATGIDSLDLGFGLSQATTAMSIINSRSFNTNLAYEYVEQNFVAPADSTYYIGFHDYSAQGNTVRIEDVTITFLSNPTGTISGKKFNDDDNNGTMDFDDAGISGWKIYLNGIVNDSTLTDVNGNYTFTGLPGGSYTVTEEQRVGWVQTFPPAGSYSFSLSNGGNAPGRNFGNFHPNTVIVRKYQDVDGDFSTDADRVLKGWHLQIEVTGATTPTIIASDESGSITASNLLDGSYTASEADSGWLRLGYVLDGNPVASTSGTVVVNVSDGDISTIDFVNAVPEYAQRFRTATPDDWALGIDAKGKHKAVKRKADKVYFKFTLSIATPALPIIEFKFNMAVDSLKVFTSTAKTDTMPYDIRTVDSKKKIWRYTCNTTPPPLGSVLQIDGKGLTGKPVKVNYLRSDVGGTVKIKGAVPDGSSSFLKNDPGLPLPNLHNVGEELFPKGFAQPSPYFGSGVLIGIPQGLKKANSVLITKYMNVYKSLYAEKLGQLHTLGPLCLDFFGDTKPISKQQSMLPPTKQDNVLFAQLLALKLNVAASATQKFPVGFGELTFFDKLNPTNPFNGQLISDIIKKADTLISCQPLLSKTPVPTLGDLEDVLEMLNDAFTDSADFKDTLSFASKTRLTGVDMLVNVPFLRKTPGIKPVIVKDSREDYSQFVPSIYQLHQNYPNPFNPTTSIRFELAEPAVVTLRIYNMLGQEVATLADHEEMDEGAQELDFDASGLTSGVYFYRIVASGIGDEEDGIVGREFSGARKMLLVK